MVPSRKVDGFVKHCHLSDVVKDSRSLSASIKVKYYPSVDLSGQLDFIGCEDRHESVPGAVVWEHAANAIPVDLAVSISVCN